MKQIKAKLAGAKDLTFRTVTDDNGHTKDRLVVMVRDPYWLHAYWELGRKSIERAKVALGPVLARRPARAAGVRGPPRRHHHRYPAADSERGNPRRREQLVHRRSQPSEELSMDIGYLAPGVQVLLPGAEQRREHAAGGAGDSFDKNWADVAKDFDRIFALSGGYSEPEANGDLKEVLEEHLRRPIGNPVAAQFGRGAAGTSAKGSDFRFQVDTELIVHGVTQPDAHVTLHGEPVKIRSDGTFAVRFNLPDRRHVLPMVASSRDGAEQRTIVLAVDRNTKVMEPVIRDPGE